MSKLQETLLLHALNKTEYYTNSPKNLNPKKTNKTKQKQHDTQAWCLSLICALDNDRSFSLLV